MHAPIDERTEYYQVLIPNISISILPLSIFKDKYTPIKNENPLLEVIMPTVHATVDNAIEKMKRGALGGLMRPCNIEEFITKLEHDLGAFDGLTKPFEFKELMENKPVWQAKNKQNGEINQ
ncbi:hypothetical protein [uncultured Desulfobacter sp.]|uniref:hypothetical protein n=1 Tax=uncultured Desulfobacter sp. TaxID=240139 RepID=UPI002AAAB6AD|nr:hypothetical protein [uncultured Desulfobacter sp.]